MDFATPDTFDIGASPLEGTVVGHEYLLKLITHSVRWTWGTVEKIFANEDHDCLYIEDFGAQGWLLESGDEMKFKVEE